MVHCQTHHGVVKGGSGQESDKGVGGNSPRTSRLAFPEKTEPKPCSFEGFSGLAATWMSMRIHFWHRHVRDTMVILE